MARRMLENALKFIVLDDDVRTVASAYGLNPFGRIAFELVARQSAKDAA